MEKFREQIRLALEDAVKERKNYVTSCQGQFTAYQHGYAAGKIDGLNLAIEVLAGVKSDDEIIDLLIDF